MLRLFRGFPTASRAVPACASRCVRYESTTSQALAVPTGEDGEEVEHTRSLSARVKGLPVASRRPDITVQRPPLASFKKGLAREILKNLRDFPHALLLCRVGQFYESYFDQAIEIADLLKIRLTSKPMEGKRYPMCGFPVGQLDKSLERLVREHARFVAICDEHKHYDKEGNLLNISRKVVRVVTPGTLVDESFIEKQQHNYLLAIDMPAANSNSVELAWIDTSTGELYTQGTSLSSRTFVEDIARVAPSEVLLPAYFAGDGFRDHPVMKIVADLEGTPRISFPRKAKGEEASLPVEAEDSFSAIPLLSSYIRQTLLEHSPDLSHPLRIRQSNDMRIDRVSLKALEIKQNNDGGRSGTLLSVIDRTATSAGMRLLGDRISAPSKSVSEINSRLSLVAFFKDNDFLRDEVVERLHKLDDEARLLQKMSVGRPTAEDLLAMARAVRVQTEIKEVLERGLVKGASNVDSIAKKDVEVLAHIVAEIRPHDQLADKIEASVDIGALEAQRTRDYAAELAASQPVPESIDEAEDDGLDIWNIPFEAIRPKKGKAKKEVETAPAPAKELVKAGKALPEPIMWGKPEASVMQPDSSAIMSRIYDNIEKVEKRARRLYGDLMKLLQAPPGELLFRVVPRFGPVLRVGWKRTHPAAMREALQTLENNKGSITMVKKIAAARYFAYQPWTKINSEMQGLLVQLKEAENFAVRELCNEVLTHWDTLRRNAAITAELDVATSLAKAALELRLVRPRLNEGSAISIRGGRHPVAEFELAKSGREFVANDTEINSTFQLHVITGPNMGGKSTVLRQVGLIAAMAQAGSFVPADSADIGIVDQIFARIRYSDNIARGRSSFRVEMDDAAYILENATDQSLVLLDEFGRGTTADYAACIAEATIYSLSQEIRARSLFATHLHDIYDILYEDDSRKAMRENVAFFCTQLAEQQASDTTSLRYLYKLEPGVNRNAEAFKVARVAGYPAHLLERAQAVYDIRNLQK